MNRSVSVAWSCTHIGSCKVGGGGTCLLAMCTPVRTGYSVIRAAHGSVFSVHDIVLSVRIFSVFAYAQCSHILSVRIFSVFAYSQCSLLIVRFSVLLSSLLFSSLLFSSLLFSSLLFASLRFASLRFASLRDF